MKYLVISPWNTSNPSAYVARDFITGRMPDDEFVVLCPGQQSWAEEFTDRVQVHTFGEPLHFPNGETYEHDPNVHLLDFVVIQMVFYSKQYGVDKVFIFGNLSSAFDVVARIRLMQMTEKTDRFEFDRPVRVVLTGFGRPDDIQQQSVYTETFGAVAEKLFVFESDAKLVQFLDGMSFTPFSVPHRVAWNSAEGRDTLERVVGLRIPAHSKLFLSLHPSNEDALRVVDLAASLFAERADLMKDDAVLFWIVQPVSSDELLEKIRSLPEPVRINIIYVASKMSSEAIDGLITASDYVVLSDPYFASICTEISPADIIESVRVSDMDAHLRSARTGRLSQRVSDICPDFVN
jgi:hypothetical protein